MPIDERRRPEFNASKTLAAPITQKMAAKMKNDQIWAAKRVPKTLP